VGLWALVVAVVCFSPLYAQERYKLGDDQAWTREAQLDPSTPEGQLQAIRKLLAEEKAKDARVQAKAWIKRYPNHPLLVEAYMLRADALVAQREYYKALFDYEVVIRQYPGSEQFHTALEREFHIAEIFGGGARRKWLGMRVLPAYDEAEEIYIRTQERTPGSELGEKASLALADFYFRRSEMINAADAYDMFLVNYPRSRYRERSMLRLIQAKLATFKGPRFDAKGLRDARERVVQFRGEFPAAAEQIGAEGLIVRIDESLALKEYITGQWYEQQGKSLSAVTLYERLLKDYSQTSAAGEARQRMVALSPQASPPKAAPADANAPVAPEPAPATPPVTPPATPAEPAPAPPAQEPKG
jgi:outer membrane protein assembly factor BamD